MNQNKKKHVVYRPIDGGKSKTHHIKSASKRLKIKGRKIGSRAQLVDILNYINFQDGTIIANFKHKKFNRSIGRHLSTRLCNGNRLDCVWTNKTGIKQVMHSYDFQSLLVNDDQTLLLVIPELIRMDTHELSFRLPDMYSEIDKRKVKRHACAGVDVQMVQDSVIYKGKLAEVSPLSFRVEISATRKQKFLWVNPESRVNLILSAEDEILYSGECKILKQTSGSRTRTYILEPVKHQIQIFQPKDYRSDRLTLVPSPDIIFKHPFTGKVITRKVLNISGAGFAVEEAEVDSALLPGMIIHGLELSLAGGYKLKCRAQVLYRKLSGKDANGNLVKCGIAILDIKPEDHMKLLATLNQAENKYSYIDNKVDSEALLRLTFKTGLMNPEKYSSIRANKEKIKETYKKLYDSSPDLARHFIYQTNGIVKGHMSMLRFYENSWLINHEAAGAPIAKAKLGVLNQIAHFIWDSHRFSSSHMNFIINYFSSDNNLSNLVFRGTARNINDPKCCSLDSFAYFHYRRAFFDEPLLSKSWRLTKTKPKDLFELESFYNAESKGLMIQALDLLPEKTDSREVIEEYHKLGIKRGKYLLSLKKYDSLKAVFLVNISDVGLNISDMTSCVKVFIMDQEYVPQDVLYLMLSRVLEKLGRSIIPVMLFPATYASEQAIAVEKYYYQWILNTEFSDRFLTHLNWLVTK